MAFISGQYTMTYGGTTIGQIEDGIRLEHFVNKRLITGDNQGRTPQDAVYQGHEAFAQFTIMEADNAQVLDAVWPYDTTNFGRQSTIGRLDVGSSLTVALVMTALASTPAVGNPTTITIPRAILAEGYPVSVLYAPDLRDIPLRLRLYPDASGDFWAFS